MASIYIVLCIVVLLQGAWCIPAKSSEKTDKASIKSSDETSKTGTDVSVSIGTELSNNINENLIKVLDNFRTGAVQLSTPVVKFGFDTMPNLFSTGFKTAADAASKIVEAKRKGFGKLINGVASMASGGAVLGSSLAGGGMQIVGSGLGATGNLIDIGLKFGLNMTGNLAESSALANMIMANITNAILNGAGKGMAVAGDGVNFLSKGSTKVIEAIGKSIVKSVTDVQDTMSKWFKSGSAKFQNGAITMTSAAQVNYYNALQWYLHNILAMEGVMDKLTETINSSGGKKSSSDEKEKSSSDEKEKSSSDEKEKSSSDEKEKSSSDEKEKSSSGEKDD